MRRRLGIAQALLNDPDILIVDEPTAGLDPEERLRFRKLLAELGGNKLVIMSTHIDTTNFSIGSSSFDAALAPLVLPTVLWPAEALWLRAASCFARRWRCAGPLISRCARCRALAGVAALSALASLFGRCSRSSRLFVALFLFGLYVSGNVRHVPMLDAAGFNGVADVQPLLAYAMIAAAALGLGYLYNRRAATIP